MEKIRLISSDNEEFTIERKVLEKSILVKNMLEDVGESDNPIPLPNVNGKILKKVIDWCVYHKDDLIENLENNNKKNIDIDEWDKKFYEVDQEMLFEIILAANYLDIKL